MSRIPTGMAGVDTLIEGGFPQKTAILVSGSSGTGKTLMGLNFLLEGASKKEKCFYLSLNENKDELIRACNGIKKLSPIKSYLGKNLIIKNINLGNLKDLDYFTNFFEEYPEVDRLVLDNVNKLLIHAENKREYRIQLATLIRYLKDSVRSSLLLCETRKSEIDTGNGEAFECDGVINISFQELEERPRRTLSITKMRYTAFSPRINHDLIIDSNGLRLSGKKII